jgi:hypothetical protein
MSDTPVTTETPALQSTITTSIRVTLSLLVAICLGIFILLWDCKFINGSGMPDWLGPYIFLPLLAVVLGYGTNCLIQYLSCKKVQWLVQLQRVALIPLPQYLMWGLLYMIPGMRWPIEGLIQDFTPEMKKGISSGFYTFWMGLYTQSIMNGLSQICPPS